MDIFKQFASEIRGVPFLLITIFLILGVIFPVLSIVLLLLSLFKPLSYIRAYAFVVLLGATTITLQERIAPETAKHKSDNLTIIEHYSDKYYGCKTEDDLYVALELNQKMRLREGNIIIGDFLFKDIDRDYLSPKSSYNLLKAEGYSVVAQPYDNIRVAQGDVKVSMWQNLQKKAINRLSTLNLSKDKVAVVTALVTGDRDLDRSSISLYKHAGIMHTLALSGLHVGIVAAIVSALLLFMKSYRLRIAKAIITVVILITYALFTGASPSVQRAVIMFIVIILSNYASVRVDTSFNALFFAAFLIILISPSSLWNISFRLSFTALLSILIFAPRILSLIKIKSAALRHILSIIVVTISAQILIIPMQMYYFSSISTVSIINNVVATLAIPIVILLGFIYLAFPIQILSMPIDWMLETIETTASITTKLPFSYIYSIELEEVGLITTYIAIFAITAYIKVRELKLNKRYNR